MFVLQETRDAFPHDRDVPKHYWFTVSRHRTYEAALKAYQRHGREMREACSHGRLSHNHRVVEEETT